MSHSRAARRLALAGAALAASLGAALLAFPYLLLVDPRSSRPGPLLVLADPSEAAWARGGIAGCENLLPLPGSTRLYASDLSGRVFLFDGPDRFRLALVAERKLGDFALGLAPDPSGGVWAAASSGGEAGWKRGESRLVRLGPGLEPLAEAKVGLPCINGLCLDIEGALWLASSDFDLAFPDGILYRVGPPGLRAIEAGSEARPQAILSGGLFNGLFALSGGGVLAGDTLGAIYRVEGRELAEASGPAAARRAAPWLRGGPARAYRRSAWAEAFDDFCADSRGRLWLCDPLAPGLAVFDPSTGLRSQVELPGFGAPSSCRARVEAGREILYLAEIKAPGSRDYDGRGILSFPLDALRPGEGGALRP